MNSFPDGFRALILGASGGIGQPFVQALQASGWRKSPPPGRSRPPAPAGAPMGALCAQAPALPLVCPNCGADRRIVAFITEAAPVRRILNHIGEPAEPPRIAPARGPPAWDDPPVDLGPDWDALAQPQPEYVFNQEVQW